MATKKTYSVPTLEITRLQSRYVFMGIAGSDEHGDQFNHAPAKKSDPAMF